MAKKPSAKEEKTESKSFERKEDAKVTKKSNKKK